MWRTSWSASLTAPPRQEELCRIASTLWSLTMDRDQTRRLSYHLKRTNRPRTLRCRWCKKKIGVSPRGRLPEYCCASHRQLAHQQRKWRHPHAVEALTRDLATIPIRDAIRAEVLSVFRELGLVDDRVLSPPKPQQRERPPLRLVDKPPDDLLGK